MADEIKPEDKRVGAIIRALRDDHGLKHGELAIALGISPSYLSNIEAGRKHAPTEMCREIAKLFRIPLAAITIPNYAQIREAAAAKGPVAA